MKKLLPLDRATHLDIRYSPRGGCLVCIGWAWVVIPLAIYAIARWVG